MIDPKLLRSDPETVARNLARRGQTLDVSAFRALEEKRKAAQVESDRVRAERNANAKAVGMAKGKGEDVAPLLARGESLTGELTAAERQLTDVQEELETWQLGLPNLLHESVPDGRSEADNREVRRWGEPREFPFEPKDHVQVGEGLRGIDFEAAARMSGARFVVMRGQVSHLHRALAQFMLDVHTAEHGYTEVYVPYLVQRQALLGTGQLPKFEDDLFKVSGKSEAAAQQAFYLISTAEVPVTNLVRGTSAVEMR